MNAFPSSLKTFLFSILFATLLVYAAGQTPSSEDVEPQEEQQQKELIAPDEYITPEIIEQTNNFCQQCIFVDYGRSSNGKPTFIRFGKRASPSFIRFGRK
ncbi:Protein CBR-FLP-4 [Caenorhabditis briggsae]|uniref:Protein CBR-FLP-4 n=1 Tax=Caenorhabditis briggsae TaxID=6238 RepID=A8WTP9_CAEBR|nr:Protein CBR-FLP-4 [Caenorhabditis briggsae]CAP23861.2 Protein CBR-FLP-4 [Caenorhabditis briggsae]